MNSFCEAITLDMTNIARTGDKFCRDLETAVPGKGQIKDLFQDKEYLEGIVKEFIRENFSLSAVEDRINDPQFGRTLIELLKMPQIKEQITDTDNSAYYALVQALFTPLPIKASKSEIHQFYDKLGNPADDSEYKVLLRKLFENIEDEKDRKSKTDELIDAIKAAVINTLIKSNSDVEVKSSYSGRNKCDYTGLNMGKGIFRAESIGNFCAKYMSGGQIQAENIGNMTAMQMSGGEIHADSIGEVTGMLMRGGRIYTRGAGEKFGWCASGGVFTAGSTGGDMANGSGRAIFIIGDYYYHLPYNKTGGAIIFTRSMHPRLIADPDYTVLINQPREDTTDPAEKTKDKFTKPVYGYDENRGYYDYLENEDPPIISSEDELLNWKKKERGLCVIDDLSNISGDPTKGLKDGIMVLRAIPDGDFCSQMDGGVVILEAPNLTYEEAQKRVKMDRKITGVVLMRVPVPAENNRATSSKTKLIEVK